VISEASPIFPPMRKTIVLQDHSPSLMIVPRIWITGKVNLRDGQRPPLGSFSGALASLPNMVAAPNF